ncbi:MAG: hypothetical protein VR69_10220 [Peptococcaceae bacterium BRH_c4b]|nr:MAG: hypothetical protein VR69_10220 [Peptococcaceae bacterium BRH_c4b]
MCNPMNAYQETVKRFLLLDHSDVVLRSGVSCANGFYTIDYFNSKYKVGESGKVFLADSPGEEVPFNDRTIILQYLCEASGLPPRNRWLSFLELPEGEHHYVPFQIDATNPLARIFGDKPDAFRRAAAALGGRQIDLGDISFSIPALPKLPLAVALWEGDEDFPSRSIILFDAVAPFHLTTAALWVLGVELAHKMLYHYDRDVGTKAAITWLEGKRK